MEQFNQPQYSTYSVDKAQARVNSFIQGVYYWMAIAMVITGVMAYFVAHSMFMRKLIFGTPYLFVGLIIAELAVVFIFSARLAKMQATTATILFIVYSFLNGLTLSVIFLAYARTAISAAFFITAGTFVVTSLFGYFTKRDLTGVGHFMFMGLIGIIIATVVNFVFLRSNLIYMAINYIGVLVFVGLTAWDTQKMKNMALTMPDDVSGAVVRKGMLINALQLYLDFINLFLFILRILGSRN